MYNSRTREFSSAVSPVKNICIVGSGLMGSGIAQVRFLFDKLFQLYSFLHSVLH
ncbi:unnamed protein product [Brugia pahangi]|uniref:3HCDH_N domain-containing protein n=1 Tax=Brugia pahangi TaxID=6280 RepID=A0A0N4T9T1_BRUPA|nr:unnamed protein product [Brugia pahangi]